MVGRLVKSLPLISAWCCQTQNQNRIVPQRKTMVYESQVEVKRNSPQVTHETATIELRAIRKRIRMQRRTAFAKVQNRLLYHMFVTYRSCPSMVDTGSVRAI